MGPLSSPQAYSPRRHADIDHPSDIPPEDARFNHFSPGQPALRAGPPHPPKAETRSVSRCLKLHEAAIIEISTSHVYAKNLTEPISCLFSELSRYNETETLPLSASKEAGVVSLVLNVIQCEVTS